jgi:hypothetical protein
LNLRLEYEHTIEEHLDADAVMEHVRGILITAARLAGYTTASVDEIPKRTLIFQNVAEARRNLHQLLKVKQLYET